MSDVKRMEVIRQTYEDCLKYSPNNACTWGHEADIKFLIERHDALAAELAEAKRALEVAHLAMADNGRMWEQCIDQRDALRAALDEARKEMHERKPTFESWDYVKHVLDTALRGTEVKHD